MTEAQKYFIDIIDIVPESSTCFIQAPSLDTSEILKLLSPSQFPYFQQLTLTTANKQLLKEIISQENCEGYFQRVEIKHNGKLLFEGYDGMEFGTISRELELPYDFVKTHFDREMYIVSQDW